MEDIIIEVQGTIEFMKKEIPNVIGGFGEGKKSITDKHIAEIHGMKVFKLRELIGRNINRFKEGVDFIDLKIVIPQKDNNLKDVHETDYKVTYNISDNSNCCGSDTQQLKGGNKITNNLDLLLSLGYSKMEIAKAEHLFLLSERGYTKLVSMLDNSNDKNGR